MLKKDDFDKRIGWVLETIQMLAMTVDLMCRSSDEAVKSYGEILREILDREYEEE